MNCVRCISNSRALLIISLVMFPFPSRAVSYYVDFSAGNDTNSGISSSAPWKHCPGDANATAAAATARLNAGDSIFFKGGVYYNGFVKLNWSGTPGNPITYDGNSKGNWGLGRAVVTSSNKAGIAMEANGTKSFITIKGFSFYEIGGYATSDPVWSTTEPVSVAPRGTGIHFYSGGDSIEIQNCVFERIGQWINSIPITASTINGVGVFLKGVTNAVVRDCEFTKVGVGVGLYASAGNPTISAVTIMNCDFHDYLVWGVDVGAMSANVKFTDIIIDRCRFYNYSQYDAGNWQGYGEKPHRDGIFLRTATMTGTIWTNIVVRNCKWWDDNPQKSLGGTASIYVSQGPSVDVYNCLFLNDPQANGAIALGVGTLTDYQSVRIWNNTFVGNKTALYVSDNVRPSRLEFLNNLLYNTTGAQGGITVNMWRSRPAGPFICDNNLYFSEYSPLASWYVAYDAGYTTFAMWRALGRDPNGLLQSPALTSVAGPPSSWNVAPAAGSPLLKGGQNLSPYFGSDFAGYSRPATGPWTIGAYETVAGSEWRQVSPPSNLKITDK